MQAASVHKSLIPQQRKLEREESEVDFEIWKEGLIFHVSLDARSARFTSSGDLSTWDNSVNRGFADDVTTGARALEEGIRMTGAAKAALLKIVLSSIAYNAPVISWNFVTAQAQSLDQIWDRLRQRFGIKKSGARITELVDIKMEPGESPEALWERYYSFMEENLLTITGAVKHEEKDLAVNEPFTPTLLNTMVVLWLATINHDLPASVRYRFATQLRTSTIYSCRVEISDAIPILLSEISDKDANVNRAGRSNYNQNQGKFNKTMKNNYQSQRQPSQNYQSQRQPSQNYYKMNCCLCESAGRSSGGHFLSKCPYLPSEDQKFLSRVRDVTTQEEEQCFEDSEEHFDPSVSRRLGGEIRRVDVVPSPILSVTVNSLVSEWTLDCGAETNLIKESECNRCGVKIIPTRQTATMADGKSSLEIVGETHFTALHGHHNFKFSALVVRKLDTPALAGMPFLKLNDVFVRPKSNTIYLADCCTVNYPSDKPSSNTRRCSASILRVPRKTCLLPGETLQFPVPEELADVDVLALEPRCSSPKDPTPSWLKCQIVIPDDGSIAIRNASSEPILLQKNHQFCQIRATMEHQDHTDLEYSPPVLSEKVSSNCNHSASVEIDPSGKLSPIMKNKFTDVLRKFDDIFSPSIGCYNGRSGKFTHVINMGQSLPPQRKGRIPLYKRTDLETLQHKFDELLSEGVVARPEDVDVCVEYVHPSFLVKKSSGGFRLVTSFGQVGEYAKPQPTLMSNVEDVLRQIGNWKFIIKTDLKSAYYQIPLDKGSRKYVGVVTPYRGTLVYCRSVMGLPGSESALEELLSRILGDLILQGVVIKLADDLYCGSDSVEELVEVWESVLNKLKSNGLKLSPDKTVVCPASVTILGWLWEDGMIRATPHRLNALMECSPPETVTALRSFVGAYNFITRVLPSYSDKLESLQQVISSHKSGKIEWTPSLLQAFHDAKNHLKEAKSIVLPRSEDQLYIISDAALQCCGIGSALYVVRNNQRQLAGYFNAKRRGHQASWLPCEVEALSIGCSIRHFGPYITQSKHITKVLTDSKPCVEAFKRLCRGQFSASPRVTTYLSIAARYRVEISHIPGNKNIFSDFISRNPLECSGCQVCDFVRKVEEAVIKEVSVKDILSGEAKVPFTSRNAWNQIQQSCPDLLKVQGYIKDGLTPSRKKRNITDIRRYLNVVKLSSIPSDGLLIVPSGEPFKKSGQRIVIPRGVVDGLLTALHLQLKHPTKHQLKLVFSRGFFCLDLDKAVNLLVDNCHTCTALKRVPNLFHQQSTSDHPDKIGTRYSTDVMKRNCQSILVLRESISAYTEASIIPDEKADSLREGLVCLASRMRSPMSPPATVRSDGSTSFQALVNDSILSTHQLHIEIGDVKNPNKNPICEKAIEELHAEIVRLQPRGGKISQVILACAVSNLNGRIRHSHLSAIEIWTQRDMSSGEQLNINDEELIKDKIIDRQSSHLSSSKYKARGKSQVVIPPVKQGDVVYLFGDRSKLTQREKYLVVQVEGDYAHVQKFAGQQLRTKKYRVKRSEIITSYPTTLPVNPDLQSSEDESMDILLDNAVPVAILGEEVPNREGEEEDEEVAEVEAVSDNDESFLPEYVDVNDESFQPTAQLPVENTAATHRPKRKNAGKKPKKYSP